MENDLDKKNEYENDFWSQVFQTEMEKNSHKKFSSFWWQNYYEEISNYINKIIIKNNFNTILEAGSGSGKATILLEKSLYKTLLDISPTALEYARHLTNKFKVRNVNFVEGNIFSIPFKNNSFDFVWNIGVIEHFEFDKIKLIIQEMIRVCNKNGIVAIGIPNFYSGPIMKAKLLKILKFIPGYKINTEKFYKTKELEKLLQDISKNSGRKITYTKIEYFGNPLIIETPKFLLKTVGELISRAFKKNKFLILIICKFE